MSRIYTIDFRKPAVLQGSQGGRVLYGETGARGWLGSAHTWENHWRMPEGMNAQAGASTGT